MVSSSETDSFTCETHQDDDLQSLFAQLAEQTSKKTEKTEKTDQFKAIQQSIAHLPKISSKLESTLESNSNKTDNKNKILAINDPIVVKQSKKSPEEEDSGSKWFNMKSQEMTPEIKRDLLIIKQRNALDPKRHYKKQKWEIPKYFQMGTIVEGNTEYYSKLNRKQRGNNLVQEILHDDESNKYFKRKYSEIQKSKVSGRKGHYKKVKDMRKKF